MTDVTILASGSAGNCYRVSDGRTPILLEAGIPVRRIREALGFQVSALAGCLVSHDHGDHAKAAKDLMKAGLDLYASQGTADALELSGHRLHVIRARVPFTLGTWTVLPFEAQHDAAEPVGFLLASGEERLLYLSDSAYSRFRFAGLTHVMVECNYDLPILKANIASGSLPREVGRRTLHSHMNIDTLCDLLRANDLSRVREIILLHLSDGNSDAEAFARRVREATGRPVRIAEVGGIAKEVGENA